MKQEGGKQSVNLQAGRDVVVGVTYADVRQIALDVYKANAVQLADAAKEVAIQRAEEMTDKFLGELKERNPEAVAQASRPDFQMALLDAQKAYARTGDKDLATVLVDLLVNRTQQRPRSLKEIVLSESLQVVPRLTVDQINTISVIFQLRYTVNNGIASMKSLATWFNKYIAPLLPSLSNADSVYMHLVYSGTATQEIGRATLVSILKTQYPGLFARGFEEQAVTDLVAKYPKLKGLLQEAPSAGKKLLPPLTERNFRKVLEVVGVTEESEILRLWNHQKSDMPNDNEIMEMITTIAPKVPELAAVWDHSSLSQMTLTSVGLAIGHANFQRVTGDQAPLSIWIPD